MTGTIQVAQRESVIGALARKWRGWQRRRAAMAELDHCGSAERKRIANDIGMNEDEFRVLAGRWPDTIDLLRQRIDQLNLNPADERQTDSHNRWIKSLVDHNLF